MTNNKDYYYTLLISDIEAVFSADGKYHPDLIGKMAISSALIMKYLPNLVFAGYYLVKDDRLNIGPYQGTIIACTPLRLGQGICGECAALQKPVIVKDVNEYPNYIACDSETRSEIVLPVIEKDVLIAVLDIDGRNISQFDETDRRFLSKIINRIF